jgi:phosphoglycerate dehydrogenase-like enzyme
MRILIASPIFSETIEALQTEHDVRCDFRAQEASLVAAIKDREVLIFRSGVNISAPLMAASPTLKLLIRAGSGADNVDMAYVNRRGLDFYRVPGPGARAVAELTFGLMLGLARHLLLADQRCRQGHWEKAALTGSLLSGKILGMIGVGNVGTQVGHLGAVWGMQVIGCVEQPLTPERAATLTQQGIRVTTFEEVMTTADFVTVHVPLKDSTRYLINKDALARMKAGSYLINMARGGVVNEQDLYQALTAGNTIRGAALDVHEHENEGSISPLATLPNVLLTPHIGSQTHDTQRQIGQAIVEIIRSYKKG